MASRYDNLEDARGKLNGTIIYYKEYPVVVMAVGQCEDDEMDFILHLRAANARNKTIVKLSDPELNLTRFNLGYSNHTYGCVWWYRQPLRQYRQGLKGEQLKYRVSEKTPNLGFNFEFDKSIEQMLVDKYPTVQEIEQWLKDQQRPAAAFHKHLALSWDKIHKDMIIEHKGRLIGCMSHKMTDLKLSDEYEHLTEELKEIMGAG